MRGHMLARFELVRGAAIRALGVTGARHIQKHLGVAVPNLHISQGAGAIHTTMTVKVGGQQFNRFLHS